MKSKLLFVLLVGLLAVLTAVPGYAIPNPAAAYAQVLGYEYVTRDGGIIIPEADVELSAWSFYRGEVGSTYAYGEQYGYDTVNRVVKSNGCVRSFAVCVPKKSIKSGTTQEITLDDLMRQNGEPLWDEALQIPPSEVEAALAEANQTAPVKTFDRQANPSSWDWRHVGGFSYIGSVRNQGSCGSCYAFGAAAAAEGAFNYALGLTGGNCVDFSEAYIAWCLGKYGAYSSHFNGCDGADYDYAELQALTVEGICGENQMSYNNGSDPGSCTYAGTTTVFDAWARVPYGDIEAIKTAIMTYGVVDAAVYVDNAFDNYSSGIHDDNNNSCSSGWYTSSNHAISLVGWDDNPPEGGGGCWILRNSWGTSWGEGGYMRIRYDAAVVHCAVCYMVYRPPQSSAPTFGANPGPITATNGAVTSFTVSASGSPTPTLSLSRTTASSGYGFNAGTGVLTYTPPLGDIGSQTFSFLAINTEGNDTQVVTVLVTSATSPSSLTITPSSRIHTSAAATGQTIGISANVSWTATESLSWVTITGGSSGSGNGTVTYSVEENSGSARFGSLMVSGGGITRNFTVSQAESSSVTNTLGGAVDERTLSWSTSGAAGWFPQSLSTHDGVDAAQSGDIGDNQESTIQTTITGPGELSFWWKVSSESDYDYLNFYIDGVLQSGRISGEVIWQQKSVELSSGLHTAQWVYAKDESVSDGDDSGWVDQVVYTPETVVTLSINPTRANISAAASSGHEIGVNADVSWTAKESLSWVTITGGDSGSGNGTVTYSVLENSGSARSGTLMVSGGGITRNFTVNQSEGAGVTHTLENAVDAPALTWSTSGDTAWFAQDSTTHDGVDAAASGDVGNNQQTTMQTTITGPGELNFWWKVSSESGYDYLKFYINGSLQSGRISGEVNWQQKSVELSSGLHTVQWVYTKDESISDGDDSGWVDQVVYTPETVVTLSLNPTRANLLAAASSGHEIEVSADVSWTATESLSWVTITGGSSGSGNGTVTYSVAENSGSARSGILTISGSGITRTFMVKQWPALSSEGDFDGDFETDLATFQLSTGNWDLLFSAGGQSTRAFGSSAMVPVPADYDGDGRLDYGLYRPFNGTWYILYSGGGSKMKQFGWSKTVPLPGDYDGDGWTDLALFYPDRGYWYFLCTQVGGFSAQFGGKSDIPVPADYDGDGATDIAVYRPSSGMWYVIYSGGGYKVQQLGWSGTIPVPGDYDGDGQADIAVLSRNSSKWCITYSGGGSLILAFGYKTMTPVQADYDGDGATDIAMYHEASGTWYIRESSTGMHRRVSFGGPGQISVLLYPMIYSWFSLP